MRWMRSAIFWSLLPRDFGGRRLWRSATTQSAKSSTTLVLNQSSMVFPHEAINLFKIASKAPLIHQRGGPHAVAQRAAQRGEARHVARLLERKRNVSIGRSRYPITEAHRTE